MKAFPMFIRTTDRRVVIIGGGEQATQKVRLVLKTDAEIVVVARDLNSELKDIVRSRRATHEHELTETVFDDAIMAFVATGCSKSDVIAHAIAKSVRCPVNVVDQPELCDITTPAIVDRDPIVVAIGSEGTAPVLTRDIKTKIEGLLPHSIGGLAKLAGQLRHSVRKHIPQDQQRSFWAWVFKESPRALWVNGKKHKAIQYIHEAICRGSEPHTKAYGQISFVGVQTGQKDLLTLRAIERLQEADVVYCNRKDGEEILELARRDIERVFIDEPSDKNQWSQERIVQSLISEAANGRRIVRLVRSSANSDTYEFKATRSAGIAVEWVPGVFPQFASPASFDPIQCANDVNGDFGRSATDHHQSHRSANFGKSELV